MKLWHASYVIASCLLVILACSIYFNESASLDQTSLANEQEPSRRAADKQGSTHAQTDVIVVGAGISGLSAALELGRSGADVTIVDMASVFGGHAVMSQGGISIVNTPTQVAFGIQDSPDLAYRDFIRWGEDADPDWVRYYVDHSKHDIYDWLTEMGIEFSSVETAPGNSVDRFHQPRGRGVGLVTPIYRECLELENIHFIWNTQAKQLLTQDKRVVGVVGSNLRTGQESKMQASAVILATGGFQSNLDMVREFWPAEFRFPDRILTGSGTNSVGHGHKLAQSVGGDLTKMDHQWNYFTGIPDPRYPDSGRGVSAANMYGIIVNSEGRRFANLLNWAKEVMPPLLRQEEATLWFVFDEASKPRFVISGSDWADFDHVEQVIFQNPKLMKSADTIEELAEKSGLPAEGLVRTIRRYNQMVENGEDNDFARFTLEDVKRRHMSPKIATPPFYAMQAFPLTRKSMGGVAIDLQCRVLDKQKRPIAGLYAVGELTGLAGINGKAALEGTFLGPCIMTGRVAGRTVLARTSIVPKDSTSNANHCIDCHNVGELLAQPRPGYWHFGKVHQVARERSMDCRHCHGELAPYDPDEHRTSEQALAATCVQCHVAQE
ncbi:MAG: FAD-dependent oxidoreductase [Planctomycetes bacterium]|nr:FAD-dependent oxidoreductase [Planctomycetota bacterium]